MGILTATSENGPLRPEPDPTRSVDFTPVQSADRMTELITHHGERLPETAAGQTAAVAGGPGRSQRDGEEEGGQCGVTPAHHRHTVHLQQTVPGPAPSGGGRSGHQMQCVSHQL